MNEATLEQLCAELAPVLTGQKFGKIFPLSRFQMAIDLRLPDARYLFVSVAPTAPRLYLIQRRLKDLDKQSVNPPPFVLFLRKKLAHAVLRSLEKFAGERVVRFGFTARSEIGEMENYSLIVQLTGRSANLFLLDEKDFILDSLRENTGPGQETADRYAPPQRDAPPGRSAGGEIFPQGDLTSLSEALDRHYLEKEAAQRFQARAKAAAGKLNQELKKRGKLLTNLRRDLAAHGDADTWKRYGDLILANLATAERKSGRIVVTDYYDEALPTIEIEADDNLGLTEVAEQFFKRYTKARNARDEIAGRVTAVEAEIAALAERQAKLDKAIEAKDEDFLDEFLGAEKPKKPARSKQKRDDAVAGARRYVSSDGFEILVGKGSKDNDYLTFRAAKSLDFWLHAADYPGSHVVVRNPNRQPEMSPKTLLEAAQLAAFFSRAREQPKVAVHYTQKKFVNKPKGAGPGLVSLASFKTVLVEPKPFED